MSTKAYTLMFIAALFITAKNESNLKSINTYMIILYLYDKYYSAIKSNKFLIYTTMYMTSNILC